MRIAIIQFPGSNCERETALAVKRAGMEPVDFLWNESCEKLANMDGYIIVGGFSYEDRSRAGVIAALDPVMQEIKSQSEKGKPILGICNGAQILVETGLVPGLENNKVAMALTENKRMVQGKLIGTGYYNNWINMRLSQHYQRNLFTKHLSADSILHVPVAHAQGRFVMSVALLEEVQAQGLNVFQYCDASGNSSSHFPINPNGSIDNIAAISNKQGNVMAMMPHPERTLAGDVIFQSMRDSIAEQRSVSVTTPLYYYPRPIKLTDYQMNVDAKQYIVELKITDNHALTVQQTLRRLGCNINVKRYTHWEVQAKQDGEAEWHKLNESGVLFNNRKENMLVSQTFHSPHARSFLVREKENIVGQDTARYLKQLGLTEIHTIYHGVLWHFSSENANITDMIHPILQTQIIANPYAYDCYQYTNT